jgi:hypothetical protein
MLNETFFRDNSAILSHIYCELRDHQTQLIKVIQRKGNLLEAGFTRIKSAEYQDLSQEYQRIQLRINNLNEIKDRLKKGEKISDRDLWY